MNFNPQEGTTGLLLSGGLDSSILLGYLLGQQRQVQPFYIRSGLFWQAAELRAVQSYLAAVASPCLRPLVELDLPLADLYGDHWSVTGREVPDADTPDESVFLPGRNALLVIKAALWCQLHGLDELALGTLESNPFADATPTFFAEIESSLNRTVHRPLRLVRPFERLDKRGVMRLGRDYPLEHTFSCIAPAGEAHCGRCNKCAERRHAFRLIDLPDPTHYDSVAIVRPCAAIAASTTSPSETRP
jgi:7-cyano-7-deazaguanine synthase